MARTLNRRSAICGGAAAGLAFVTEPREDLKISQKMANRDLLERVELLQNLLVSFATGGSGDGLEYRTLRDELLGEPETAALLPKFVRTCRDLSQFWGFIKNQFGTYAERREYLWSEFNPLMEKLENEVQPPSDDVVSEALVRFDSETVHTAWLRALSRRQQEPEGAITAARTLLESVCKHILDSCAVEYDDSSDLPKLYKLTATQLNLAPDQHTELIFKQILGGCSAVVEGLGAVRNKLSDSHGRGKGAVKPSGRHAELAVNLAGAMATFLVATFSARQDGA